LGSERALGRGALPHELFLPVHGAIGRLNEGVDGPLPARVGDAPGEAQQAAENAADVVGVLDQGAGIEAGPVPGEGDDDEYVTAVVNETLRSGR